jgi:RNA polymerase sigma factor (sigma-70 family)
VTVTRDAAARAAPPGAGSFDAFFTREYPRVLKLAWLLTRSSSAAEDIAQDSFLGVHDRFGSLDMPAAYLTRVVVNKCKRWHRSGATQLRLVRNLTTTAERFVEAQDEYLLDALAALPYRQRVVIVARYWGGWSEAEIAAALGCRPGTVKSLASRALTHLRTEITP